MAYIYPFHPFFTLWERAIAVGNTRVRRPISLRSIRALAPAMCSFHCAHTPPQRCYCRWQYAALHLRRNNPIPHRLHRTICHSTTAPNDESPWQQLVHCIFFHDITGHRRFATEYGNHSATRTWCALRYDLKCALLCKIRRSRTGPINAEILQHSDMPNLKQAIARSIKRLAIDDIERLLGNGEFFVRGDNPHVDFR